MFLNNKLTNFYKYKRKLNSFAQIILQQQRTSSKFSKTLEKDKSKSLKILFFGTDHFSLPSLEALNQQNKNCDNSSSLGAVTSFKSPANCVRLYAEQQRLPLHRWPITADVCRKYDLGVVVSFGHLIPEALIKAFPFGMINVHASLLPRWRGAAPIIYAIMCGDRTTGVSIMKIEPKHFDVGDILAQREVPIKENILMPELHTKLANEGANLLVNVVNDFSNYFENAKKQNNDLATFAPKISPKITEMLWSDMSAKELHNRYRALYSFKHLTTRFEDKNVQLIDVKLPTKDYQIVELSPPGSFVYLRDAKCLLVRCTNKSYIEVHQLRIEGKKVMSAMDFNNGFLKKLKENQFMFVNKIV